MMETALPEALRVFDDDAPAAAPSNAPSNRDQGQLTIRSALILEDNFTIALDLESMLRAFGLEDVVVAASLEDALQEAGHRCFDIYLLDINLGGTTSIAFAEQLVAGGQYVVFTTGYGEHSGLPASLRGVPILDKPYAEAALFRHLSDPAQSSAAE